MNSLPPSYLVAEAPFPVNPSPDLFSEKTTLPANAARPFLKWAGGKTQLLPQLRALFPEGLKAGQLTRYVEPFLGSGAVFFDVMQRYELAEAVLCDVNGDLVLTYQTLQARADDLVAELHRLQTRYAALSAEGQTRFFYEQRDVFNQNRRRTNRDAGEALARAAQFIFLNKTCFNGLYRVNAKGDFNTPAGRYANPTICDVPNLLAVERVLQRAEIRKADFREIDPLVDGNTFVYFDPPYRPISATSSFKAYSKTDFSDREQAELARLFAQLDGRGAALMLSNSDPKNHDPADDFFDRLYAGFTLRRIPAKRMINSVAEKRGAVWEIVVVNYGVGENR